MDAVVLVGGFGTRLRPLTNDTPKQMLPVGHATMLEVVLARLASQGITRAILSLGYKPEVFQRRWPDGRIGGLAVEYAVDPSPLDTAGAIRYAVEQAGVAGTFVAVNGDVITSLDVREQIAEHRRVGAGATIHLVSVDDPSRYGVVSLDEQNRVLGFVEKPSIDEAPSNLINAGTYVLEPEILDFIPAGEPVSIERATFPLLVERGVLQGFARDGYWIDAGTPEAYLRANLDWIAGAWSTPGDPISSDASVHETARVESSVIGSGATVAADAVVRGSVVMAGAEIGSGAVVTDSIIGEGATIGHDATITDHSVIGPAATVASGVVHTATKVPEPT